MFIFREIKKTSYFRRLHTARLDLRLYQQRYIKVHKTGMKDAQYARVLKLPGFYQVLVYYPEDIFLKSLKSRSGSGNHVLKPMQ